MESGSFNACVHGRGILIVHNNDSRLVKAGLKVPVLSVIRLRALDEKRSK